MPGDFWTCPTKIPDPKQGGMCEGNLSRIDQDTAPNAHAIRTYRVRDSSEVIHRAAPRFDDSAPLFVS